VKIRNSEFTSDSISRFFRVSSDSSAYLPFLDSSNVRCAER
jgi:hypothetical protein